jgi:hypothetical protein
LAPSEALAHVYARANKAFSENIVVALVQMLSVYPPGSIVELSDGKIGLVLSLNLEARMKPMVLLYGRTAPKDAPHIVDLAKEPNRSIVRHVPKHQIEPAMKEYLSFHRWTGYFIESSYKVFKEPVAS